MQHHEAAKLYYEYDLKQQEVANMLGISRVAVSRLLARAKAEGIVEVTVNSDVEVFPEFINGLKSRYGLKQVWVAPAGPQREVNQVLYVKTGVRALQALLTPDSITAVAVSRTLAAIVSKIPPSRLVGSYAPVQGSAEGLSAEASATSIANALAIKTEGTSFILPAPLLCTNSEAASFGRSNPGVRAALDRAKEADRLFVGIGSFSDPDNVLRRSMSTDEYQELAARGAVGDIGSRFFNHQGEPIFGSLHERTVGLTLAQLLAIPERILFSYGGANIAAINVALERGLVTGIVTDSDTASKLLKLP